MPEKLSHPRRVELSKMNMDELTKNLKNQVIPIEWPGHWINGQWVRTEGGDKRSSANPNRDTPLMHFSESKKVVELAVSAAHEVRGSIGQISQKDRLDIIRRLMQACVDYQEPLIHCMQLETGKPAWEARADMDAALRHLKWISENDEQIYESILAPAKLGQPRGNFTLQPVGVTAAFLPFSTPITSFVFYFTATILTGCPLILFTSTHATLSCLFFAMISEKLNLPKGLLNVVFGSFLSFRHTITDKRVMAIIYIGSHEHCEEIRRESRTGFGRQLILHSGGKNSVIVHSTADIQLAVKAVIYGIVKSSGQLCSSTSRVFVYRSMGPEFRRLLTEEIEQIKIGPTDDFSDPVGPLMGPLYSRKAVERFLRFQTMALREAKETLNPGKSVSRTGEGGSFVTPGVHYMEKFDPKSAYQRNVIFCPDLCIYEYDALDDAIANVNDTDAALSVSFIGDGQIINDRRHLIRAPNVLVNLPTVEVEATLPLAGRFTGGLYRFHGPALALYLCLPQVVQEDEVSQSIVANWPWPKK
jgi:aldehyde dehydrogenase (NAD+)